MRIGLLGIDSSHAEDFLRHFNREHRHRGTTVTGIAGGTRARLAELQAAYPDLAASDDSESLIAGVDAVIVGHRDGALHRDAALAAIAAQKPVFVDKPLANAPADAEAIADAAAANGTPILSGSALRWQAATQRLKAKVSALAGPIELRAWGTWYPQSPYGGPIFYAIHTIELAQELIGTDWRELKRVGDKNAVRFRSGPHRVTLEFRPLGESGHSEFGAAVKSDEANFGEDIVLDDDYMVPVARKFVQMIESGRSQMTRDELLAPVRMMAEIDAALA